MMKRISLSALFMTTMIPGVLAAHLSSVDALGVAGDFLVARGIETSTIHPVANSTRSGEKDAPYHLFNIGEGDGFIIVADDDRQPSVIGYSLEGSISPESIPEACTAWLEACAGAITSLPGNSASKTIAYPTFTVDPLLRSRWDQTDPYNRRCPIDRSTGRLCVAGCVAVAAAQVMAYHRYPATPAGRIEYEDRMQGETRSFDFSAMAPIDWENMSDTYSSESSEKECDAVASLMNAMAHGSRMQFSSSTSMALNYNAGHALIDFFGYHPDMHYYERALVSDEEWISIITSELQAGRPVLYEGRNPAMGHAFVCDGYDGQGFFHINWGWSGLSDGYFSLSALTPPGQSTGGSDSGYSLTQTILCNIAPKETSGLLPQEIGLLNVDNLYFRDSNAFHIAADVDAVVSPIADALLFFYSFNKGMKPFSGQVCAALTDSSGITPLSTVTVEDLGSLSYTAIRFPLASIVLPDGTYSIGFYYRTSPSGEWHPIGSSTPGAPSQCRLTFSGTQVTMSALNPNIRPEPVSSLVHSRLYTNSATSLSFELVNSGSVRLEAYAGVAFMRPDGGYFASLNTPVLCPAGDKVTVEIEAPLKDIPAGEYLLMPFYSYSSRPEAADIHPLADAPFPAVVEGLVLIPSSGSYLIIDPDRPRFELNVTNLLALDWSAPVVAEITSGDGACLGRLPESQFTLAPSATSSFEFDCSGLSLARGNYKARFLIADDTPFLLAELPLMVTADMTDVSAVEAEGIEVCVSGDITVKSPEKILSCALYDTAGRITADIRPHGNQATVRARDLPTGIYILRISTESGKLLTRKLKL